MAMRPRRVTCVCAPKSSTSVRDGRHVLTIVHSLMCPVTEEQGTTDVEKDDGPVNPGFDHPMDAGTCAEHVRPEFCDLCEREMWKTRKLRGPPVEHEDMDKFCLGPDGLYPKPCLDATRARIAVMHGAHAEARAWLESFEVTPEATRDDLARELGRIRRAILGRKG